MTNEREDREPAPAAKDRDSRLNRIPRRWMAPVAVAATVVLCFSLVMRILSETQQATEPAVEQELAVAVGLPTPPPPDQLEQVVAVIRAHLAPRSLTAGGGRPPAGLEPGPEDRLAEILRLYDAGEFAAARRAVADFRESFPDHPLIAELDAMGIG